MAKTDLTFTEVLNSLTGHDELAIHAASTMAVTTLAQTHQTLLLRALIAVHEARENGERYGIAYGRAMSMRMDEVADYFADDPDDLDPESPDSEAGKDS